MNDKDIDIASAALEREVMLLRSEVEIKKVAIQNAMLTIQRLDGEITAHQDRVAALTRVINGMEDIAREPSS